MTRDGLIEQLADVIHREGMNGEPCDPPPCDPCRIRAQAFLPVIKDFFAEWLTEKHAIAIEGFADDGAPLWLDVLWLEEMAGPGEGEQ